VKWPLERHRLWLVYSSATNPRRSPHSRTAVLTPNRDRVEHTLKSTITVVEAPGNVMVSIKTSQQNFFPILLPTSGVWDILVSFGCSQHPAD
jgi:hypothetical protein